MPSRDVEASVITAKKHTEITDNEGEQQHCVGGNRRHSHLLTANPSMLKYSGGSAGVRSVQGLDRSLSTLNQLVLLEFLPKNSRATTSFPPSYRASFT